MFITSKYYTVKYYFILSTLFLSTILYGQRPSISGSENWKLYYIMDENAFSYSIDTLKNFSSISLNADTIKYFLIGITELPANQPQSWQGAYIATFDLNDRKNKIEISHYGGLLYDESKKRHYQISEDKIDAWLSFVRRSFMTIKNR